ncbi:hypothetical protein ACFZC5_30075 [Nocardia gamkensis]|uniref:hypothetical protein n=1 Tax=Nocardia gamkensis TaxID=352869 RepID=UPI0036E95F89
MSGDLGFGREFGCGDAVVARRQSVAKTVQIGSRDSGSVRADGEENRIRSAEFERQLVVQPVLLDAPVELSDAVTHDHTPCQWLQLCDHPTGKTSGYPGRVDFVTHGRQITEIPHLR